MSARQVWSAVAAAGLVLGPALARADLGDAPPAPPVPEPAPALPPPVIVVPYPYPPPYTPYTAPSPAPPAEAKPTGFSFKIWAGPAYRRVYDVAISGGDFGMSFGAQRGFYGEIAWTLGRTDQGLFVFQFRPQATGELRLGPVRLGLGAGIALIGIHRALSSETMLGAGIGLSAFATVDLYRHDQHALYLGAKMALDWLPGSRDDSDALVWGPNAMLGWRY